MKISKQDALNWYTFFNELPYDEELLPVQQEIALSVLSQIETAVETENAARLAAIPGVKCLDGRTYYVGDPSHFPSGCKSCLMGTGLSAVRRTNKCNLKCPFCYDFGMLDQIPAIGEDLWEIGGGKYRVEDIDLLLRISQKPTGIAYVYLEPFMEIELYGPMIRKFADAGIHQHMYTNGTLCTPENLRMLADAGLPELRFNLGATNCADKVIENIRLAKTCIPQVGIETPMTRAFRKSFMEKKQAILATGIDFINCAELHLNENNLPNYQGENMYMFRNGYLSPVISRRITFEMMEMAVRESWNIVVHDCSNHTKFARDLHHRAKEGGWFGATSYGSEFDRIPYEAFLPILSDPAVSFVEEEPMPADLMNGGLIL
ncbi:MAG: radical SAM protein [Clostridia bacterium]|nr:radical SAM protein [Clostridia bacterium]